MKKVIAVLLSLAMVAMLAACGSGSNDTTTTTKANDQTTAAETTTAPKVIEQETVAQDEGVEIDQITLASHSTTTLNAFGTRANAPGMYEVYEMLYECDVYGEIQPFLADATYDGNFMKGCDHEKGSNIYTVHIYDYIKDHKGRDVTAEDVAFSYIHALNEENTSGWKDNLIDVRALDDSTVEFEFAAEQDGVGQLLNVFCRCVIVNEESYNESSSHLADEMIGTGPYKFDSYISGAELTLVKNEDYWQTNEEVRRQEQQANVKKLVYKFIDESSQQLIGLKTGELDFCASLASKDVVDFKEGGEYADKFNVYSYADKMVVFLAANCDASGIMGDVNMRMAVFNSIDQDGLITARGGYDTRLYSYACDYYTDFDWVDWASKDNYNTKTGVDSALVKEYLEKANYNGETLTILARSGDDDDVNIIISMLQAQGINATSKLVDQATAMQLQDDPSEWDITYGTMAGDYNVTVWEHAFSYGNTSTKDKTQYHLVDDEWEEMLETCLTEAGHTPENMEKWWDRCTENAYAMGLYATIKNDVLPKNMVYYTIGDKLTALTGASIYK